MTNLERLRMAKPSSKPRHSRNSTLRSDTSMAPEASPDFVPSPPPFQRSRLALTPSKSVKFCELIAYTTLQALFLIDGGEALDLFISSQTQGDPFFATRSLRSSEW